MLSYLCRAWNCGSSLSCHLWTKRLFFLDSDGFYIRNSPGRFHETNILQGKHFCRYSAVHSTDQSCGQQVSGCLHLKTKRNLPLEFHNMPQFDHWPKCTPPQLRPPAWTTSWALLLSSDGCGLPQLRCPLAGLRWTRGSQRGRELTTAFPWLVKSLSRSHRLRVTC